jgi:hypothetical protein
VSGRSMMYALVSGERDPQVLAQLALRSLRAKIPELQEAFTGGLSDHHAFALAQILRHVDAKNGILRMSLAARVSSISSLRRLAEYSRNALSSTSTDFFVSSRSFVL